jgi:hypothetical protein
MIVNDVRIERRETTAEGRSKINKYTLLAIDILRGAIVDIQRKYNSRSGSEEEADGADEWFQDRSNTVGGFYWCASTAGVSAKVVLDMVDELKREVEL